MKLTTNFTLEEFTNTQYKDYLADNIYFAMNNYSKLQYLAEFAQKVRNLLGVPMTITSGVRYPLLNIKVGGKETSQHTKVEAFDFIPAKITLQQAFDKIRKSDLHFGQLIIEKSGNKEWIHIGIGEKREILRYENGRYIII